MKFALSLCFLLCCFRGFSQTDTRVYEQALKNLDAQRLTILKLKDHQDRTRKSSAILYKMLTNNIFPAWYDTPWDFNGTSNVPGEGQIACGYFVSTTLKHAGFNLNRYKLAQQASAIIAEAVCGKKKLKRFYAVDQIVNHLKTQKNGLYIVGLDYHVGFLVVDNGTVDFVHADYFNVRVVREPASTSTAFRSSDLFVLGEVTDNQWLMQQWLSSNRIY